MEIDYTNLGAVEREQTQSDLLLGSFTTPAPIPDVFMPEYNMAIEMQGKIPACGSHAGAYLKNIQEIIQTGEMKRFSPLYLWKRIKLIDNFPPESGTDMLSIFKTLQKNGVCDFSLTGNDVTQGLAQYTDPSTITPEMDSNALTNRIGTYAFSWNPSFDDIKRAIYQHKVVLLLFRIGPELWVPSWSGKDILPLKPNIPSTSGHFMIATGYNEDYIFGLNEWSDKWGDKGGYYFGRDYASRVVQMGTAVDFSKYVFSETLRYGMRGEGVSALQKVLKDKGYFTYSITGYFGSITKAALQGFQKDHSLDADGIAGPKTIAVLNSLL